MNFFYVKRLDGRHSANQHYAYRAELVSQKSYNDGREAIKHLAEARQYLWTTFGQSAELDELYAIYGHDEWPCWAWRQHHISGRHLYFAADRELAAFLLKYAEYCLLDKKIKF